MPDEIPQKPVDLDPPITEITQRIDSFQQHDVEPIPPPYVREPLFNKKVMAVWALGALAVWFAFRVVLPVAFESAKSAIVENINQAEASRGRGPIRIERTKNGITITTDEPAHPPAAGAPPATPVIPPIKIQIGPQAAPAPAAQAAPAASKASKK
jgi:hypothetical protein